jgi:capsular polysaccharide export protein
LVSRSSRSRHRGQEGEAAYCFGFRPWKFGFVRAYLVAAGLRPHFCAYPWQARLLGFGPRARLIVWGLRESTSIQALAAAHQVPIWRMEDGFLRSVGLGSDFNPPASLVLDKSGLYFDPRRASDLETSLQTADFTPAELARAAALRESIVLAALSKYNFSGGERLERVAGKRIILVPGQVEDDASIAVGCVDIRTNLDLLMEVRRQNPTAHVIFKPHPDLLSGNRKVGALDVRRVRELSDQVIEDAPLPACLAVADEVHTMTSLVGFEALLRGLSVTTYGRPFYSGWGLTVDRHCVERRTRRLSLDMLVAGSLIHYPMYFSRKSSRLTSPEEVVEELVVEMRERRQPAREPRWRRRARKLRHAIRGVLHGP